MTAGNNSLNDKTVYNLKYLEIKPLNKNLRTFVTDKLLNNKFIEVKYTQ